MSVEEEKRLGSYLTTTNIGNSRAQMLNQTVPLHMRHRLNIRHQFHFCRREYEATCNEQASPFGMQVIGQQTRTQVPEVTSREWIDCRSVRGREGALGRINITFAVRLGEGDSKNMGHTVSNQSNSTQPSSPPFQPSFS